MFNVDSLVSFPSCRALEPVAMEPAWRQQGRGRGRSQEAQGERSRPPQKEKEKPELMGGVGGKTKSAAKPERQVGEDALFLIWFNLQLSLVAATHLSLSLFWTDRRVGPI